jgi:hypothetical protein
MVRSTELIEAIQRTVSTEEWKTLGPCIIEINQQQGRSARKNILEEINKVIIETSIKNNNPSLLSALPDIQNSEIEALFSQIIKQYIQTKDDSWLNIFFTLSEKLPKKSNQSKVYAMIARDLIDAGVSDADTELIDTGMILLNRISFRKYRSDIMIDIIPLLIVWAVTIHNKKILEMSLIMIEEIGDISKRSVLHAELVKALASIAIQDKDRISYINSIISATKIHQKIRRQQCLLYIIEKGAKSHFGKEMADLPLFLNNFSEISGDAYLEVISALIEQMLERIKDKSQVILTLKNLSKTNPSVAGTIILDLLNKADRSGDQGFFSAALELQNAIIDNENFPVREIVRSAISVACKSNNMQILIDIIPVINKRCTPLALSKIFLQFSHIMLTKGDFYSALRILGTINHEDNTLPQYTECLTYLLKEGVIKNAISPIDQVILSQIDKDTSNSAIYRAIIELSKEFSFDVITSHDQSIKQLIAIHHNPDQLLLENITILIDRGILDAQDPDILVRLAESINDKQNKERAISSIIVKIAKIGVRTKNRDFLQRAVGLTCEIEGQNTRSSTLCSIIDDASLLAAHEGDLDLLLRMKVWSSSLLEKDLATFALANIVEGITKYAIDKQSAEALEEAYGIAQDINDPALKTQLFEQIAECFVKIGCILLLNPKYPMSIAELTIALGPFERGLDILKHSVKSPQLSLKIAGIIDVIISFYHTSTNPDFIIPLAMFTVEIDNNFERDAMISRIISNMSEDISHPDSTDPYEIMTGLLQKNERVKTSPSLRTLISRVIQMIHNPYAKLNGLCNLLDVEIKSKNFHRAQEIQDCICKEIPTLPAEYQKILILTNLAIIFSQNDTVVASKCLRTAVQKLESVEYDWESEVRKHIVIALVGLNKADPKKELTDIAFDIVKKITDPVEYIESLILIYGMVHQDKDQRNEFLHSMTIAADKISSPYEKASVLLNIIFIAQQDCDDDEVLMDLLSKAELTTKKINIPLIIDTIRDNITQQYAVLYQKSNNKKILNHAIRISKTIDNDNIRLQRFAQLGYAETYEIVPQYVKIKTLSETMIGEGNHPNQIITLERLVRTVADRGKESIIFCDLAIYFKKMGEKKLSERMIQNAIKEARIIRPLSRRSYIMCDIALKLYSAGCEQTSQEILDYSIDSATNIRQSTIRDEVFDELGHAIKIIQER